VSRMNTKLIFLFVVLLSASVSSPVWAEDVFPSQPVLEDYLTWASEHHPVLEAGRAQYEATRQSATEAGALPDLRLAWGEMIVPVETRVGPQQRIFSVSQNLPWFGTLGSAEKAADFKTLASASLLRADSLAVENNIRKAWYDLARLQQEIEITTENLGLSRQSEDVALRAYESGTARFRNVLQAQMESDNLRVRVASLKDRLAPATVALNSQAGLPSETARPLADLPEEIQTPLETSALSELLHRSSPKLESLRMLEESQRHLVETARLSGRPGLTFGLDYIMTGSAAMPGVDDSGKDPVIARVAINVPLWSGKATARRLASASRLQAVTSQRQRVGLDLDQQLESILFKIRDTGRNWSLYQENLLPRARQILTASISDYETGRATFDEVIGARENLLALELSLLRARMDQALAFSDLEALLATPSGALIKFPGKE